MTIIETLEKLTQIAEGLGETVYVVKTDADIEIKGYVRGLKRALHALNNCEEVRGLRKEMIS